jgi:cyclase
LKTLRTRIIPSLLLKNKSLVKTVCFGHFTYVGDPANTVRIFNELEVDELILLDIGASLNNTKPDLSLLADIAEECFMPLAYGGGITTLQQVQEILEIGFEKIIVNSSAVNNPSLINEITETHGSQSLIVSIDVKVDWFGKKRVRTLSGKQKTNLDPVAWAQEVERMGAGEIFLTSIDREGTWEGFDLDLVKSVSDSVNIPVVAHGGAGTGAHIKEVINAANASAVALGSMVVYQKKGMGVLVNFPNVSFDE